MSQRRGRGSDRGHDSSSSCFCGLHHILGSLGTGHESSSKKKPRPIYTYRPLAGNEIRLLRVSRKEGRVDYALKHFDFNIVPPYTALSYCWEDQEPDQELYCDGSILKVTANIKAFLSSFSAGSYVYIWIDAVCINQFNETEKVHQISLMKMIYRDAHKIVIWLGESSKLIDEAVQRIPDILYLLDIYQRRETISIQDKEGIEKSGPPIASFPLGINEFLSRPWFTRLWTFQEAILPKNVEFNCGKHSISHEIITKITSALSRSFKLLRKMLNDTFSVQWDLPTRVNNARRVWSRIAHCRKEIHEDRGDKTLSMAMLLYYGMDLLTTKPADKIYGMLGLADESIRRLISVDYRKSHQEVFIDFARIYLGEGHIGLLNIIDGPTQGLPSWCPNFLRPWSFRHPIATFYGKKYTAGLKPPGNRPARSPQNPGFAAPTLTSSVVGNSNPSGPSMSVAQNQDVQRVVLQGFRIGSVSRSFPSPHSEDSMQRPSDTMIGTIELVQWLDKCLELSSQVYSQPGEIPEPFVRVLMCIHDDEEVVVRDHKKDYEALMMYARFLAYRSNPEGRRISATSNQTARGRVLFQHLCKMVLFHSFFSTTEGSVGVGPKSMQTGDEVCIFYGGLTPFVIRPTKENPGLYELVGECYLDGLMKGEAFNLEESEQGQAFTLV